MTTLNITVVGTGYVGLVSGVCFAALGHNVTCVDNNSHKVQQLQKGVIPIYEPGLDDLVRDNVSAGRLHFSDELAACIDGRDAIFIAVGTPTAADGTSADLSAVNAVARALAPHLRKYAVIVTKSTVPVLTNKKIEDLIRQTNPQANFDICSNPEFLREGCAIDDFMNPDRIVIGVRTAKAQQVMEKLYRPLTEQNNQLLVTTPESAELIKYASNAFLATKVAFINEVANIAEVTGGNIDDIAHGMGLDSRIGPKFLQAGPGYGGSCFPKDTRAFAKIARDNNAPSAIVEAVIESNNTRKKQMADKIAMLMDHNLQGKKIAVLGVTFKANTDDMREAVSLNIIPALLQQGAEIHAFDPAANHHAYDALPQAVYWHKNADDALHDADAILLLTEWPQFRDLSPAAVKKQMRGRVIIDLRNFLDSDAYQTAGFTVHGIGKTTEAPVTTKKVAAVS